MARDVGALSASHPEASDWNGEWFRYELCRYTNISKGTGAGQFRRFRVSCTNNLSGNAPMGMGINNKVTKICRIFVGAWPV